MNTEALAAHLDALIAYAPIWGFFLILFFMTVESSFIPFPSEVVMIPAGFLAYRGLLSFGSFEADFIGTVVAGIIGSLLGALINYYLSLWLGRPFLHRYGKYFFLSEKHLNRAEEIFREYGDIATFVCRLLPAIRQLISIPAGLSKMNVWRFLFFTGLGAGIWVTILTGLGAYLGHVAGDKNMVEIVNLGKEMLSNNYWEILVGLVLILSFYFVIHKWVMTDRKRV